MTYYRSYLGNAGFSLTELLVVIVIIGVLVLLALPRFTSVIDKTKTTEAKLQLKHLHTLQKSFFYEHDRYSASPASYSLKQTHQKRRRRAAFTNQTQRLSGRKLASS